MGASMSLRVRDDAVSWPKLLPYPTAHESCRPHAESMPTDTHLRCDVAVVTKGLPGHIWKDRQAIGRSV
jgi:hypothetical protein